MSQTKRLVGASVEHGVDTACYSGGPGEPYMQPVMICLCYFSTGRCPNWETAGCRFDDHLADVERRTALPAKSAGRKKGKHVR